MAIATRLGHYAGRRLTRRVYRSMPWIGGLLALVAIGGAVRRKGFLRGTVDTLLDFTPFVGAAKNIAEVTRGRDFFPDKTPRP